MVQERGNIRNSRTRKVDRKFKKKFKTSQEELGLEEIWERKTQGWIPSYWP